MEEKKFGEFNNFDDFFNDLLSEIDTPESDTAASEKAGEVKGAGSGPETVNPPTPPLRDSESSKKRTDASGRVSRQPKGPDVRQTDQRMKSGSFEEAPTAGKSFLFFAALAVITVIAWCLPLRPTESISEKRTLDTFPEFSTQALLSGDYYSDIESWFSDTFTFREQWISFSNRFKDLYGINKVMIIGDAPVTDAIPVPVAAEEDTGDNNSEPSEAGQSVSAEDDTAQSSEALTESLSEEESSEWGGLSNFDDDLIAEKAGKLMIGDSVFAYPGFNESYARQYADIMNDAAGLLEGKANFYCLIAPNNVSSMLTRADREKYGFVIEEDALDFIYSLMDSDVKTVNVLENLQEHNDEYIVFRTDPHWTAVGAYYAYEEWCNVAGKTAVPLSEYEEVVWENFYGTYYYTSGEPKNLKDNPDSVHAFYPPGDVHLYLNFDNSDRLGEEYDLLLDRSVRQVDQYVTFLTSDEAKATLINNSIDDDSACLVLKTSFGNPFVYYLTQHYHTVYVVDMRYYGASGITSFVDEFNIDDVIFIHATDMCYSEGPLSVVRSLIR